METTARVVLASRLDGYYLRCFALRSFRLCLCSCVDGLCWFDLFLFHFIIIIILFIYIYKFFFFTFYFYFLMLIYYLYIHIWYLYFLCL